LSKYFQEIHVIILRSGGLFRKYGFKAKTQGCLNENAFGAVFFYPLATLSVRELEISAGEGGGEEGLAAYTRSSSEFPDVEIHKRKRSPVSRNEREGPFEDEDAGNRRILPVHGRNGAYRHLRHHG